MYSRTMTSSDSTSSPPGGFPATAFFSRTYDEAQGLTVEALDYARDEHQFPREPPAISLLRSQENMRLTARLTQITAWLLFQRAVHAGELTPEQASSPSNRMGRQDICLDRRGERMADLAPAFRDLLLRSRKLYERVARLDEMIARDSGSIF